MPAVRIEDDAFGDIRYERLARECGLADADHARGKMARLWRQCTAERRYQLDREDVIAVLGERGPDALCAARLGEMHGDKIRIRGTRGRIEWLEKLRNNGRKGGRPPQTKREPSGFRESNPPALVTAPVTAPDREIPDPPIPPKGGSSVEAMPKGKKPKPSDPTPDERATALRVLERVGSRTGISYEGSEPHVRLITRHLRDGLTERELRGIAAYCWGELGWSEKPEMHKYLRPETLFGPQKLHTYLPGARAWLAREHPEANATGPPPAPAVVSLFARHNLEGS